jgi:hypothetical protein
MAFFLGPHSPSYGPFDHFSIYGPSAVFVNPHCVKTPRTFNFDPVPGVPASWIVNVPKPAPQVTSTVNDEARVYFLLTELRNVLYYRKNGAPSGTDKAGYTAQAAYTRETVTHFEAKLKALESEQPVSYEVVQKDSAAKAKINELKNALVEMAAQFDLLASI